MEIRKLIRLNPEAWTAILRSKPESAPVTVREVEAVPLLRNQMRYRLTLEDHQEPIVFLAKKTNTAEARFYRELSSQINFITPRCLFSYVNGNRGWIVLDDVPEHRPAKDWTEVEVERIIGNLASLHIAFWGRTDRLLEYDFLPYHIRPVPPDQMLAYHFSSTTESDAPGERQPGQVSAQSRQHAGPLLPAFEQATRSLELLRDAGGWRGVIDPNHLNALADLLDDPLPMLAPLRQLPSTLIHRNLAAHHWRLTMFGDCALLDWQQPAIGPSVVDLVQFTEQSELMLADNGAWRQRDGWPISVETMVDTYLLRLYDGLWPMFNARQLRQALPPARCLHLITDWLPRLMPAGQTAPNLSEWEGIRPYLQGLFRRFWHAYRTL